jgi:hypothetical protein
MTTSFHKTALVLGMMFASACGGWVSYTPVNAPPHDLQPRVASEMEVFTSGAPARPHVDVGYFQAKQPLRDLRAEAASLGCDGLVITQLRSRPGEAEKMGRMTATCIVYTDVPVAVASAKPVASSAQVGSPCERSPEMQGALRCQGGLVCRAMVCVRDDDRR